MSTTPSEQFRHELRTLRDAVLTAIDGAVLGDVEDGLTLYARLVETVLDKRAKLATERATTAPSSWLNRHGREMEWLIEDIRTFIERSWRVRSSEVLELVAAFFSGLLGALRRAKEVEAHRDVLGLAEFFYFRSLQVEVDTPDRRSSGRSLLIHIRSYAEYQIRLGGATAEQAGFDIEYLLQVARFLLNCCRMAVDAEPPRAEGSLAELDELLEGFELQDRGRIGLGTSPYVLIQDFVAGFLLGLMGYALLLCDRGKLTLDQTEIALLPLARRVRRFPIGPTLHKALDDRASYPWSMLETSIWPEGQRSGTLGRLEEWICTAGAIELVRSTSGTEAMEAEILPTLEGFDAEHRLKQIGEDLLRSERNEWLQLVYPGCPSAEALKAGSAAMLQAAERQAERESDARALLDLDPEKVGKFATAVEEVWSQESVLRFNLDAASDDPVPEEWMGYSQLIPKEFFVTSDVYADPTHFGQTVGSALVRGESQLTLDVLDQLPRETTRLADLSVRVQEHIAQLKGRDLRPTVIVVNSWRAMRELCGPEWRVVQDEGKIGDVEVRLDYTDHDPVCYVVDLNRTVITRRWRIPADQERETVGTDGRLFVSVDEVTPELANSMLDRNSNLGKDKDGNRLEREDSLRQLRRTVRIRVWAKVDSAMGDPSAGYAIDLLEGPDDT